VLLIGYGPSMEIELSKFCVGEGSVPNYEVMIQIRDALSALASMWKIDVK